jgi:hypothetical protein
MHVTRKQRLKKRKEKHQESKLTVLRGQHFMHESMFSYFRQRLRPRPQATHMPTDKRG